MDLKRLFDDDDAVSPVIGVILMVAITVILAAVIASFVLGLGDQTSQAPQASFGFEYDSSNTEVTVTHESGDQIEAQNLIFRGDIESSGGSNIIENEGESWNAGSSDAGETSIVKAGMSTTVNVKDDSYEISLIYEEAGSGTSTTLTTNSGPAA
ncbi:type IV pilin [Halomicrobium mukohataei]|uniref:Type IV pilin n=1 Tax=Halomicrobium mukohataei TaxID=57705 RepID=A0A847UJB5_9EURY|nr:type IV pilin N-terminal domain-containing protein [Halomicrobium mukohataei]NLV11188.1 type IV pilin [Halomicrobium mukohataei]